MSPRLRECRLRFAVKLAQRVCQCIEARGKDRMVRPYCPLEGLDSPANQRLGIGVFALDAIESAEAKEAYYDVKVLRPERLLLNR